MKIKWNSEKVHHWTHHIHHAAEIILASAVVYGSHLVEAWAIGCTGFAAFALICFDCIEKD